jgi:VCBS repeat-containing protein
VSFSTSNDNDELFAPAGQPAIDSDGTLTYTPAANESGSATVKVVDTSAEQTFTVKVRDTTAPSVSCNATPNKLRTSANNHKLVNITASVTVNDKPGGSGQNGFKLISVTRSQADSGLGPGDVPNDIQGWTTGTPTRAAS